MIRRSLLQKGKRERNELQGKGKTNAETTRLHFLLFIFLYAFGTAIFHTAN